MPVGAAIALLLLPIAGTHDSLPPADNVQTTVRVAGPDSEKTVETDDAGPQPDPCLTVAQLESAIQQTPAFRAELARMSAVGGSGTMFLSYRGLAKRDLQALVEQGDSAAMVVLGAMMVVEAHGLSAEEAVPYLVPEDAANKRVLRSLYTAQMQRKDSPEFRERLAEAKHWFYQAALHGRVMALGRAGEALGQLEGGPVQLGWISQSEFDALSLREQSALFPDNVYTALYFELAPSLKGGPHGEIAMAMLPQSQRQQVLVDGLANKFLNDLADAGLPPIQVRETEIPPPEELLSMLCEGELPTVKGPNDP